MLHIDESIIGSEIKRLNSDDNTIYIVTGYGQDPGNGANYVIAKRFDSDAKGYVWSSHLLKDIVFVNEYVPTKSALLNG